MAEGGERETLYITEWLSAWNTRDNTANTMNRVPFGEAHVCVSVSMCFCVYAGVSDTATPHPRPGGKKCNGVKCIAKGDPGHTHLRTESSQRSRGSEL